MVNRDDYKATLDRAVAELTEAQERRAALDAERDQLDARIAELKQGIMALAPLCGVIAQAKYADLLPEFNPLLPAGLKESILSVLEASGDSYITPVAIRDGLSATRYEIKSENILPSIHNVLKRLVKSGEVEPTDLDGKTGYRIAKKKEEPTPTISASTHIKRRVSSPVHRRITNFDAQEALKRPPQPNALLDLANRLAEKDKKE